MKKYRITARGCIIYFETLWEAMQFVRKYNYKVVHIFN